MLNQRSFLVRRWQEPVPVRVNPGMKDTMDLEEDIEVDKNLHQFRAFSEFKHENKGGYIQAKIPVPPEAIKLSISLVSHDKKPHVNLLFISPRDKMGTSVGEMTPEDSVLRMVKIQGAWTVVVPQYWKNLNSGHILGCNYWNKDTSELVLGKNALQVTVCKAAQKVNSGTSVRMMEKYLGLGEFQGEFEKVRLLVEFQLEEAVTIKLYSQVIFDQNKYDLEIHEIFNRIVCNKGDQVIVINFNKGVKITKDKSICLRIYTTEVQFKDFTEFEVIDTHVVKFKLNLNNLPPHKAAIFAFFDDPDMLPSYFNFNLASNNQQINIIQHQPDCLLCQHNKLSFRPKPIRKRMPAIEMRNLPDPEPLIKASKQGYNDHPYSVPTLRRSISLDSSSDPQNGQNGIHINGQSPVIKQEYDDDPLSVQTTLTRSSSIDSSVPSPVEELCPNIKQEPEDESNSVPISLPLNQERKSNGSKPVTETSDEFNKRLFKKYYSWYLNSK